MAAQRRLARCCNPLGRLQGPQPAPARVCAARRGPPHGAPGQSPAGGRPGSERRQGASPAVRCLPGASARSPSRWRAERAPPGPGSKLSGVGAVPFPPAFVAAERGALRCPGREGDVQPPRTWPGAVHTPEPPEILSASLLARACTQVSCPARRCLWLRGAGGREAGAAFAGSGHGRRCGAAGPPRGLQLSSESLLFGARGIRHPHPPPTPVGFQAIKPSVWPWPCPG